MDDGDVAKFTDAIKDFDGMTRLVCCLLSTYFLVLHSVMCRYYGNRIL